MRVQVRGRQRRNGSAAEASEGSGARESGDFLDTSALGGAPQRDTCLEYALKQAQHLASVGVKHALGLRGAYKLEL